MMAHGRWPTSPIIGAVKPMKVKKYIYISKLGVTRMTSKRGSPNPDEIELELNLEIPKKLFERRSPKVNVVLPDPPSDETAGIKVEAIPSEEW
jgi:hypothetical protein